MKRIQKANKEILKQNTQLTKAVESLRKEKDLLVSEKVRLKSENKCLEKELKKSSARDHRFTKKSSQPLLDDEVDDLKEKIQVLEDQLAERDRIASLIKLRLDKSQVEVSEETEDMEKSSSSVLTKNGSVLDSSTALEMLLEEHDTSLRLKRENEELKSRLSSMEAEAEGFKGQRDLLSASPKTPRKRSSGFFKRGKKNNSSGALKNEEAQQVRADLVRSQSPDVLVPSDSLLDVSISPLHTQKDSTTSLPNYNNGSSSPNLSPHMPTKNKAHTEIVTLQSCLRIAIEEKAACNDCIALLEKELDGTKSKIAELEDSISTAAEKASAEREQLRSELQAAKLERDTFCGELKIVQQEVDELVDQNEKVEVMYTGSMAEKNKRIQELEEQVEALKAEAMKASEAMKAEALKAEALKKSKVTSPTYSKPPAYGVTSAPKKQMSPARERVLSPPHQSREAEKARATESSVAKSKQEKAHATESSVAKSKQEKAHAIESSVAKTKQEKAHAIESSVAKSKQEKAHTAESSVAKSKQEVKMSKEDAKQKQEAEPLKQAAKPAEEKREVKVDKVRERLPSVDSARHDKPGRLSRERSQEKLSKVPPSPTRRTVGKLSRESSIDRFENPPVKEIKRLTSTSGIPSPSLTHSPKVSATRAMFEQKIDETKTDLRRSSKSILEQRRRSSVSTATVTTTTVGSKDTSHSKSYSCDLSLKEVKLPEPSTGSTNRSTKVVAPAPTTEQGNEARAQSNEAKNKINSTQHQQQDKPPAHAAPVAAARKQLRTSENVAKVSRITVTSVASPTNSPVLNTRKDIAASSSKGTGEQPSSSSSSSAMLLRHPTSPSLGTSHRQASSPTSSAAGQTRVSTVTATVRHSSPSKAATVSEIPAVTHSPVAKSQTESRIHPPSNRTSALWSNSGSSHGTPTASTTTVAASTTPTTPSNRVVVASTTPTPSNRYVVKTSSRLGDNLLSPVNKSGSLQNIPAQFGRTSPQNQNDSSSSSSAVSVSSTSSGIRRGPTHKALQRRERKDRPKTMYAGRAETANLVGLISRFQEAEKDKKLKENGVVTPTSSLKMNGSTTATTPTKSSGISFSSAIPTAVPTRQSNTPKARPTSYYRLELLTNTAQVQGTVSLLFLVGVGPKIIICRLIVT